MLLPLHAIWVGIVTIQLSEHYDKEFERNTSRLFGAAGLKLQGQRWDWDFRGWGWVCRHGTAGMARRAGAWDIALGLYGFVAGAAGLGLEVRGRCLARGWSSGAGAAGLRLQVWGWGCRLGTAWLGLHCWCLGWCGCCMVGAVGLELCLGLHD